MSKAILKSLALLGALAFSGSAQATTVDVVNTGSNVWNGNGHISASLTMPGAVGAAGGAGAFGLTDTTGTLGNFIAFCVDIAHYITNPPGQYELTADITDLGHSATVMGNVQALFNTAYDNVLTNLTNNNLVAGFQMALWEVLYETGSGLNVSSGNFTITSSSNISGAVGEANTMLGALGSTPTGSWDLTFLKSYPTEGRQNLVTASVSPVPVPAAGLLLLAGLAGLGLAARRRKEA